MASKIVESSPIRIKQQKLYEASWVKDIVERERKRVEAKQASKPEWLQTLKNVASGFVRIATELKPIIDIFVPQSPEYSVPYACLWIVFKVCCRQSSRCLVRREAGSDASQGFAARKEKIDSVLGLIISLSEDIRVFDAYKDMFPTDDMKITLAEFYIHTVDLLWRLAKYYSHKSLCESTASFKYMPIYRQANLSRSADRCSFTTSEVQIRPLP